VLSLAQVLNGKGFEYACLLALRSHLENTQPVSLITNPAFLTAELAYRSTDAVNRHRFDLAANAAARVLLRLEPQLENPENNIPLQLTIQHDRRGQTGDVRDVLAIRRQNQWEIGLSAKHNHSAVKHSRLSQTIDFGEEWLSLSSSVDYFNAIRPYFDELEELRRRGVLWRNVTSKAQRFYVPILNAFMQELQRLHQAHPDVPSRLLSYLLGRNDFYKVIAHGGNRTTEVQGYSIYGTLNRPAGGINPQVKMPRLRLPNTFYNVNFKPNSSTTIFINCDEGWNLSARIHSAKTEVEPSLKFDIQLIGVPQTLYRHIESWT
jgi:hypothetical protein